MCYDRNVRNLVNALIISSLFSAQPIWAASFARHEVSPLEKAAEKLNQAETIDELVDDLFLDSPKDEREELKKEIDKRGVKKLPRAKWDGQKIELSTDANSTKYSLYEKDKKLFLSGREIPEPDGKLVDQFKKFEKFMFGRTNASLYQLWISEAKAGVVAIAGVAAAAFFIYQHYENDIRDMFASYAVKLRELFNTQRIIATMHLECNRDVLGNSAKLTIGRDSQVVYKIEPKDDTNLGKNAEVKKSLSDSRVDPKTKLPSRDAVFKLISNCCFSSMSNCEKKFNEINERHYPQNPPAQ